jgi:riboflavin kinase/FMN adenylyltransferase
VLTPITITGVVMIGMHRGALLGYPTINMVVDDTVPEGVYASMVYVDGLWRQSMSFVGAAVTFDQTKKQLETYIFDFNDQLYGRKLELKLVKWLRSGKRFANSNLLRQQMALDARQAKILLTDCG